MKIVDPEGADVTPEKLKEIQKKKGVSFGKTNRKSTNRNS